MKETLVPISSLSIIRDAFGAERAYVSIPEAAKVAGIGARTIRNHLASRTFPVKTTKVLGRRMIHVADLALWLDTLRTTDTPQRGRTGRPTKAQAIAKRQREQLTQNPSCDLGEAPGGPSA